MAVRLSAKEIALLYLDNETVAIAGWLYDHLDRQGIEQDIKHNEQQMWLAKLNSDWQDDGLSYLPFILAGRLALSWVELDRELLPPPESKSARFDARQLKDKLNMVEIAERYTKLTGNGEKHGRCPIHGGDTHDAFYVNPEKQLGYCHTCGWRGDVFKLVMDMEHISFVESVRKLSDDR